MCPLPMVTRLNTYNVRVACCCYRSVGRMATWLYCRFREYPPGSTDTTAGLMVESEDSS